MNTINKALKLRIEELLKEKKYDEIPTGDEQRHNAFYPEKHSSRNSFGQSVVNSDTHSLWFQYDSE